MRVLFYIEPLIEMDRPLMKQPWVVQCNRFAQTLIHAGTPLSDLCFIVPDCLFQYALATLPQGVKIGIIKHFDVITKLGPNSLDIAIARCQNSFSTASLAELSPILHSATEGFTPDIAIAFAPCPELAVAWPGLCILHTEFGPFSRAPYPETIYLDPYGMFKNSALGKFADSLKNQPRVEHDIKLIKSIREEYRTHFVDENPLNELLANDLHTFAHTILLSLQFSQFYGYDAHATYKSQYDLLISTLHHAPADHAVLVVEHPDYPVLDKASYSALKAIYPNLIWKIDFRFIQGCSQYAIPHADTVVTVSSSVGLQAAFWNKPLVVAGSSHLDLVADSHDLKALSSPIAHRDKSNILASLLRHYYIPGTLIDSPGWLKCHLEKFAFKKLANNHFEILTLDDESILNFHRFGKPAGCSLNYKQIKKSNTHTVLEIFWSDNGLFHRDKSLSTILEIGSKASLNLKLPSRDMRPGLLHLRVDPCNEPSIIKLYSIRVSSADQNGRLLHHDIPLDKDILPSNHVVRSPSDHNCYIGTGDDPSLLISPIKWDEAKTIAIEMVIRVDIAPEAFAAYCTKISEHAALMDASNRIKQSQLIERNSELAKIKNSFSYRLSKPLRLIEKM